MPVSNIIKALGRMLDDLGTVEVVTLDVKSEDPIVCSYTRIDMDGDVIGYQAQKVSNDLRSIHLESVNAAVKNRKASVKFLINLSKKIKL